LHPRPEWLVVVKNAPARDQHHREYGDQNFEANTPTQSHKSDTTGDYWSRLR
jgi:hypothetical protein